MVPHLHQELTKFKEKDIGVDFVKPKIYQNN